METVRRRRPASSAIDSKKNRRQSVAASPPSKIKISSWSTLAFVFTLTGVLSALAVGYLYRNYLKDLHEAEMWFSNIKEVEREISFRTECGLYYSYYKQLVVAPTLWEGITELMYDTRTEHPRIINILERFNIYQEVFLGILYRVLPIKNTWERIYFYLDAIFNLQGVAMLSLFLLSWFISGVWTSGVLMAAFFVSNRATMTRSHYAIPLREHFSIPFIYLQILLVSVFFRRRTLTPIYKGLLVTAISVSTLCLALTWQFAQFVLLLESFAVFGTHQLMYIPKTKASYVYLSILGSLLASYTMMFFNDMIPRSLCLAFVLAALTMIVLQEDLDRQPGGLVRHIGTVASRILMVFALTGVLNMTFKTVIATDPDEHIMKFVRLKLGLDNTTRDFDVKMYLCNDGFGFMRWEHLSSIQESGLLVLYGVVFSLSIIMVLLSSLSFMRRGENHQESSSLFYCQPDIVFNLLANTAFGLLAISATRFGFLWWPHVAALTSGLVCNVELWEWISTVVIKGVTWCSSSKLLSPPKQLLPILFSCLMVGRLYHMRMPSVLQELNTLREFYDPDTVELMQWIEANTMPDASFCGSMQLLAGVKLCTGRHITNHPHYENKWLRNATHHLMQIYSSLPPEVIHKTLAEHKADYVILENSICYSEKADCAMPNMVDELLLSGAGVDLRKSAKNQPRFCHSVRHKQEYAQWFRLVLENRTFRVYRVQ